MTSTPDSPAVLLKQAATEMHDFAATTAADPWTKDFVLWPVSPAFIAAAADWLASEARRADGGPDGIDEVPSLPLRVARAYLDSAK